MVKINWLESAREDLKSIFDYISQDSERYVQLQLERIYDRVQVLKKNIEIGKVVPEIKNPSIRELVEGNYRIIYRIIDASNIHVLMIHHHARDLNRRI